MTHLHTDHAGGLHHFPDTEILVSRDDLEVASGLRGRLRGYPNDHWPDWFAPTVVDLAPGRLRAVPAEPAAHAGRRRHHRAPPRPHPGPDGRHRRGRRARRLARRRQLLHRGPDAARHPRRPVGPTRPPPARRTSASAPSPPRRRPCTSSRTTPRPRPGWPSAGWSGPPWPRLAGDGEDSRAGAGGAAHRGAVPAAVRRAGAVAHRRPRHARGAALRRARGRRQHPGGRARGGRAARALPRLRAGGRRHLRPRRSPARARSPPTWRGSWSRPSAASCW